MIRGNSEADPSPEAVRQAIKSAQEALNSLRGFLPADIELPLQSAQGKLRVALVALDAWESARILKKVEKG